MIYVLYTWYIRQILISIENMQMHRHIIFFNIFGLSVGLFYLYDKAIYKYIYMYVCMYIWRMPSMKQNVDTIKLCWYLFS